MKRVFTLAILMAFFVTACEQTEPMPTAVEQGEIAGELMAKKGNNGGDDLQALGAAINAQLEEEGAEYRVEVVEWLGTDEVGQTVFFNNRGNKQLGHHFVPNDTRRAWSGPGSAITWANDLFDGGTTSGLTAATTAGAIRSAMTTWQNVNCSTLPLNDLGDAGFDLGFVQFLFGFGGLPGIVADVTHAGFLPGAFFDILAPGGSNFILGVTFTFVFVGGDSNNDGKLDTAFREIYYNDAFPWAIGSIFDVETVALHEAGHGLSQGHFGKAFRTTSNGKLHFSPRAVMNAAYSGVQTTIGNTDNGGHCSIWGSWPNN